MDPQVIEYYNNKGGEIKITNYAEEQISKEASCDFEAIFDIYFTGLTLEYECEIIVTQFNNRPIFAASVAIVQKNRSCITVSHSSALNLNEVILIAMQISLGAIKLIQDNPGLTAEDPDDETDSDDSSPTAPEQQNNAPLPRLFNVDEVINSSIKYKKNPPQ